MSNDSIIASRTILAVEPDGREFELTIGIGQPYEHQSNHWRCRVLLSGLWEDLSDGGDSWQALQIAFFAVKVYLERFIKKGGQIMWLEEREPMLLEDLFGDFRDHRGRHDP